MALIQKQLDLVASVDDELALHLVEDALENVVSAFDGFGRETVRIRAAHSTDRTKAENLSFQNLRGSDDRLDQLFGVRLSRTVKADEWQTACTAFQKRHLLAHKMGVADQQYISETGDKSVIVGRKISVTGDEVVMLISIVERLGDNLVALLPEP